jgi:hypothetical protein
LAQSPRYQTRGAEDPNRPMNAVFLTMPLASILSVPCPCYRYRRFRNQEQHPIHSIEKENQDESVPSRFSSLNTLVEDTIDLDAAADLTLILRNTWMRQFTFPWLFACSVVNRFHDINRRNSTVFTFGVCFIVATLGALTTLHVSGRGRRDKSR